MGNCSSPFLTSSTVILFHSVLLNSMLGINPKHVEPSWGSTQGATMVGTNGPKFVPCHNLLLLFYLIIDGKMKRLESIMVIFCPKNCVNVF